MIILYSFCIIYSFSFNVYSSGVCAQDEDVAWGKKSLAFEAIADLHRQLDDDQNGGVDPAEAALFSKDKLTSVVDVHRQKDLSRDDDIISLLDLWVAWQNNPAHNWTVKETVRWLYESVELPEYDQVFITHSVDGESLPRLVTRDMAYLQDKLLIKNPFHRRKLSLKTMDLILFGPPKETTVNFYKELSILAALVTGVFGVSMFCLNYHYLRKMCGNQSANTSESKHDELYQRQQQLQDLQHKLLRLKDNEPNFDNVGAGGNSVGRMTCDVFENGFIQSDSGRSSEQASIGSTRPDLSSTHVRQSIRRPNSFHISSSCHQPVFNVGGSLDDEDSSRAFLPPISSKKSFTMIGDAVLGRQRSGGQQMKQPQQHPTDFMLRSTELALWLQLTHELELRHYSEKRSAASRQLMAAREACDRVRRKQNTLLGSVRLIHSDNLDDVDCKLNAARHVLENVTADLQERRNRWSRIEELTGMCLQDPVDIGALMSQLGLQPFGLESRRSTAQQQDGGGSSSARTPVDFSTFESCIQSGFGEQEGWYKPLDFANGRNQSISYKTSLRSGLNGSDETGRNLPDSVEQAFHSMVEQHPTGQQVGRLPRNYSFVRPFATFWRRKAKSRYSPPPSVLHYQPPTTNFNALNAYEYIS